MNTEFRERLLKQLREPNPKADMLIERYFGNPAGATGCRPYTQDVEVALTLLPEGVHFLCGRFEEGKTVLVRRGISSAGTGLGFDNGSPPLPARFSPIAPTPMSIVIRGDSSATQSIN